MIYTNITMLLENAGKDVSSVKLNENKSDHTIFFHKTAAIKIKSGNKTYLYLRNSFPEHLLPSYYNAERVKSMPDFIRIEINKTDSLLGLSSIISCIYDELIPTSAFTFGCCNYFNDCSDALECILEDKTFASGCMYKENLENGRIFYGKNRNS